VNVVRGGEVLQFFFSFFLVNVWETRRRHVDFDIKKGKLAIYQAAKF